MKKPFKVLLAICALGATFLTTSCTKEYIQTAPPPDPPVPVLFSTDIQPFFNARCTNCHGNIAPNLESDVFYWEKYTTKPWVDNGQLKRVGEFITPWPCFMVAATNKAIEEQPENIIRLLRVMHDSCDSFMQSDDAIKIVSERMHQKLEDVERWYHSTEWSIHGWVSEKMLKSVIFYLQAASIIDGNANTDDLVWIRKA